MRYDYELIDLYKTTAMSSEGQNTMQVTLKEAIFSELTYIRSLGADANLTFVSANQGMFEALLYMMCRTDARTPVYELLQNVESKYSKQSGLLKRLNLMRQLGLLEELPGLKRSEVCLIPSDKLVSALAPIILNKYNRV